MTEIVDKSGERIRQMFGEIAPTYDRLNHLLSMNIDRSWRRRVVRQLSPQAGQPILDVCTGTGDLAIEFLRYTRGENSIVAADFCGPMLEIGRRKLSRWGDSAKQVLFEEADAQQLPYPNKTFQFVTVAFGLRNICDPQKGIAEMVRVCRTGGSVAVLEFSTPRRQPMKSMYGWYFRNALPLIGRLVNRNRAYEYLPASVEQFPAYEPLADWLREAGLRDVRFYPLTFGIATLYVGVK